MQILLIDANHVYGRGFSLLRITIDNISTGLETHRFSFVDTVKAYLARIEEISSTLHAVVEINPEALSIAEA